MMVVIKGMILVMPQMLPGMITMKKIIMMKLMMIVLQCLYSATTGNDDDDVDND